MGLFPNSCLPFKQMRYTGNSPAWTVIALKTNDSALKGHGGCLYNLVANYSQLFSLRSDKNLLPLNCLLLTHTYGFIYMIDKTWSLHFTNQPASVKNSTYLPSSTHSVGCRWGLVVVLWVHWACTVCAVGELGHDVLHNKGYYFCIVFPNASWCVILPLCLR